MSDETPRPGRRTEQIDKYEICALVGSGGMGTVYRARMLGPGQATKEVALKILHPHLCYERDFIALFLNEMRLAMAMTHRNIVQTFDAGAEEQRHYMVMELVDGCSLRAMTRLVPDGGRLPLQLSVFIVREIAAALDYAHGLELERSGPSGVIHRDVCPNNILVSRQGDVKLADFGVAKAVARLDDRSSATLVKGKLRYMSPEQASGRADPRSDLFSLGAVLHELLYGRPLREGASLEAVRRSEATAPAPPPAPGDLPAELVALAARCTHPRAAERLPSAAQLTQALDAQLHALRQRDGLGLDPHGQLGAFLNQRLPDPRRRGGPDTRAARVARLLLSDEERPRDAEGGGPAPRGGRRRTGLILAGAGALLLLSLGIVGALWWMDRSTSAGLGAGAGARAGVQRPPDARGVEVRSLPSDAAPAPAKARVAPPRRPPRGAVRRPGKRRPGLLEINAVPWAYVYIDGKRRGVTPIQGLRLPPGVHKVRLVNPALKASRTLVVRLRPGQHLRRVVILK